MLSVPVEKFVDSGGDAVEDIGGDPDALDELFVVQAFVDHRWNAGLELLVKWQGYPSSDNSWEHSSKFSAESKADYWCSPVRYFDGFEDSGVAFKPEYQLECKPSSGWNRSCVLTGNGY